MVSNKYKHGDIITFINFPTKLGKVLEKHKISSTRLKKYKSIVQPLQEYQDDSTIVVAEHFGILLWEKEEFVRLATPAEIILFYGK